VTFTSMERFDLVQLAGQQDASLFDGSLLGRRKEGRKRGDEGGEYRL